MKCLRKNSKFDKKNAQIQLKATEVLKKNERLKDIQRLYKCSSEKAIDDAL